MQFSDDHSGPGVGLPANDSIDQPNPHPRKYDFLNYHLSLIKITNKSILILDDIR